MKKHARSFLPESGFTLIEMLVVIGIIGILSGVLLSLFGGATDSAKAAKCMTNMRNLAAAASNYAMITEDGSFPAAGSYAYYWHGGKRVAERRGWISWYYQRNPFPAKSHPGNPDTVYLACTPGSRSDEEKHYFALTNGAIWAQCGRSSESYVCPVHAEVCNTSKKKIRPYWSYVMNSRFGFCEGSSAQIDSRQYNSSITSYKNGVALSADRVLLFAEVPFVAIPKASGSAQNSVQLQGENSQFDCVLQYDSENWSGTKESIGFNHKSGKRYSAHVAFADGHVSKLMLPKDMNDGQVRELTMWLCQGDGIVFDGKKYTRPPDHKADKDSK